MTGKSLGQNKRQPLHGTEPDDKITGDSIYVQCRTPSQWKLFQMSGTHKGHQSYARKNAKAVIERAFTNVQK